MARKCTVHTLSDNCLGEVANMIVSTFNYAKYTQALSFGSHGDMDVVMVEVNKYMERIGATMDVYQDLLRIILSSDYLDANMRFTCLQTLLNGSVSFLNTAVFPFSYYNKILQVVASQGTGLRTLNMKGVWVNDENMHYMLDIIKKCRHLTQLYVPYIATDELLEEISKYSTNLRVLDISGETDVTEVGLYFLANSMCNKTLTVVDIGMPGEENICYSDVALILENCPNVETLATYSFVGLSLKFVHNTVNNNFKCKLKYIHDTGTDEETLRIIVKTCPHLESLYLDTPQSGILPVLNSTFLRKLKIYKFVCTELMSLLDKIGRNVDHLTLIKGNGRIDLSHLNRACPILIDLDCYMLGTIAYSNCHARFQYLQGFEMLNSSLANCSLKALLGNCNNLKRLAIDNITFTDEEFISVFIEHNFDQLEDVWFTLAPSLTMHSIDILIDRCPELQSIGQLSGWALSPDDLVLLRGILKSENSSLTLMPHGAFP